MMNRKEMLGVSSILILIAFMIPSCQATIEKNYGEIHYPIVGHEYVSFQVKMVVETESDGTWRNNTWYNIYLVITLTYIDTEKIKNVWIDRVGLSAFPVDEIYPSETQNATIPFLGYDGAPMVMGRWQVKTTNPEATFGYKVKLEPSINYKIVYNPGYLDLTIPGHWEASEPVHVEVTNFDYRTIFYLSRMESLENELNIIRNLMYLLIAITIFLSGAMIYFMKKAYRKL
ncbi:MAG: hypothetical protein ACPLZG_10485 [Thermoproteota archaeon]